MVEHGIARGLPTGEQPFGGPEPVLMILRAEIEAVAAARGMPKVPAGVMKLMLAAGRHDLEGLKPGDLKDVRHGSSRVTRVAAASFGSLFAGMTPDQMRSCALRLNAAMASTEQRSVEGGEQRRR